MGFREFRENSLSQFIPRGLGEEVLRFLLLSHSLASLPLKFGDPDLSRGLNYQPLSIIRHIRALCQKLSKQQKRKQIAGCLARKDHVRIRVTSALEKIRKDKDKSMIMCEMGNKYQACKGFDER